MRVLRFGAAPTCLALTLASMLVSSTAGAEDARATLTIDGAVTGAQATGVALMRPPGAPESSALLIAVNEAGVYLSPLDGGPSTPFSALPSTDVAWIDGVALPTATGGVAAYPQPSAQTVTLRRISGPTTAPSAESTVPVARAVHRVALAHGPNGLLWLFGASNTGALTQWEVTHDGTDFALDEVRSISMTGNLRALAADSADRWLYLTEESSGLYRGPLEPDGEPPALFVSTQGQVLVPPVGGLAVDARNPGYLLVATGASGTVSVLDRLATLATPARSLRLLPEGGAGVPIQIAALSFDARDLGPGFEQGALAAATGASNPWAHVVAWTDAAGAFDPPLNGADAGTDAGTDGGTDAGTDGGTDAGTDGGSDAGAGGGQSRPPGSALPQQPMPSTGCSAAAPVGALLALLLVGLWLQRRSPMA